LPVIKADTQETVSKDLFSESTLGIAPPATGSVDQPEVRPEAVLWTTLFQTPTFKIQVVEDVEGVALCGALKSK
jgi:glycerol-3-phosphate dehydrogenase (NAD+)